MTKKQKYDDPNNLQKIESSLSKAEIYIENNQKKLTYIIGALILIIAAFFLYKNRVVEPRNALAVESIWGAERFFEIDSFHIALYGNENVQGFLDVVDEFGSTKSGNLAKYYAGVCYLRMGEYDNAIKFLKDFRAYEDLLKQLKLNLLGDAYSNKQEYKIAADNYMKAAKVSDSEQFSSVYLLKAGMCFEKLNDKKSALAVYSEIKNKYPQSDEGQMIDKYIVRVTL